jgi:hypothetical protein
MSANPKSTSLTPEQQPVSRGCCLAGALGLVALAIGPCLALWLVAGQELNWTRSEVSADRVWLVQEADAAGIGYSATRPLPAGPEGSIYARTTVTFLLWHGHSESTTYCECYTVAADGGYEFTGSGDCASNSNP